MKVVELAVFVTLLACATGRTGKKPVVDFFLMHCLTSSIFLPAFMAPLSISQRRTILRTHLLVVLQTALARGRPAINTNLLMNANPHPVAPGTEPEKSKHVISDPRDPSTRNAWTSLIESCLYAHDSHVPKSIRSLVHYSTQYGSTPPGGFIGTTTPDGKEVLPGMGKVDGSIFLRGAGLIMDVMGWCREGQEEGEWGRSPLGYDEVWK